MVEYSKVHVKLSDRQLKQLKTTVKDKNEATLQMTLKMLDGNHLLHDLLLTTGQKTKLRNAFNHSISTDLKFSKAQVSKTIQSGGFVGLLLSKLAGPLMNVAIPLAKNVLASLGITAAASVIDAGIKKKIHSSGTITLIFLKEEMDDIMKSFKLLKILIFW